MSRLGNLVLEIVGLCVLKHAQQKVLRDAHAVAAVQSFVVASCLCVRACSRILLNVHLLLLQAVRKLIISRLPPGFTASMIMSLGDMPLIEKSHMVPTATPKRRTAAAAAAAAASIKNKPLSPRNEVFRRRITRSRIARGGTCISPGSCHSNVDARYLPGQFIGSDSHPQSNAAILSTTARRSKHRVTTGFTSAVPCTAAPL